MYWTDVIEMGLFLTFIVSFVATIMFFKKKENDNLTKVLLTALEKGRDINPELLAPKKKKQNARNKWALLALLVSGIGVLVFSISALIITIIHTVAEWGTELDSGVTYYMDTSDFMACGLFIAIGIALLIGYFVGKKLLKPELDNESAEATK